MEVELVVGVRISVVEMVVGVVVVVAFSSFARILG